MGLLAFARLGVDAWLALASLAPRPRCPHSDVLFTGGGGVLCCVVGVRLRVQKSPPAVLARSCSGKDVFVTAPLSPASATAAAGAPVTRPVPLVPHIDRQASSSMDLAGRHEMFVRCVVAGTRYAVPIGSNGPTARVCEVTVVCSAAPSCCVTLAIDGIAQLYESIALSRWALLRGRAVCVDRVHVMELS